MRLIFVRHAEPDYVHDSLTEKGFREAEILAGRTAKWNIDELFCSTMGRAKETMRPSLKNWPDIEPQYCQWLQEFHYKICDPYTGEERIAWDLFPEYFCSNEELHDKNKWVLTDLMQYSDMKGHLEEVKAGIDGVLAKHGYNHLGNGLFEINEHDDSTIVFFCHFGITSVIVGHLLGIAAPVLWQGFVMSPTSVTVLNSEERKDNKGAFRIQYWGDVRHLPESGEPISQAGYFAEIFQQ